MNATRIINAIHRGPTQGRTMAGRWDKAGMALSLLCAVHCLASLAAIAFLATGGALIFSPVVHETGLAIAIGMAAIAFLDGAFRHGFIAPLAVGSLGIGMMMGALSLDHGDAESWATLIGLAFLFLGHDLNRRATA